MADVDPKALAQNIDTGFKNRDLSQAIQTIEKEQKANPDGWKKELVATNAELDKISKDFGILDLVGAEQGNLILENSKDHKRIKLSADTNHLTITTPDGKVVDVQKSADGSEVQQEKLSDGKFHVTKIMHPSGSRSEYQYDANGQPKLDVEFDAQGNKTSEVFSTDNATWHKRSGPPEMQPQMFGKLTVDDKGVHTFQDNQWHTTFVKRPDGSQAVFGPDGKEISQFSKPPEKKKS